MTKHGELNSSKERALTWNVADHQSRPGRWFSDRYRGLAEDVANASAQGLWQYFRSHRGAVEPEAKVVDEAGRAWSGLNVASQDYLGLAQDPRVHDAAIRVIEHVGVHSSGAPPMGGGLELGGRVAARVGAALGKEHVLLFPTGWAAGYGIIRGLVRPHDYVVIDALAHNCLQHGAASATPNVSLFAHNDMSSLERRLSRIRGKDPEAAILIATEALFSMDSDGPDLDRLVALKRQYDAHVLLDIAHDFGVLGPGGVGAAAVSSGYCEIDYVIGSFSKTFASIGGFIATGDLPSFRAIQGYSGSYTFSNTLIPPQLGAIDAAMDIAFSTEGEKLRGCVRDNAEFLREGLAAVGLPASGDISPLVIVIVGSEALARLSYRHLLKHGVIMNCIEFPAVRRGEARFRMQLTPDHTREQLAEIPAKMRAAVDYAQAQLRAGTLQRV
jgi:glycine C-acetyltransferase